MRDCPADKYRDYPARRSRTIVRNQLESNERVASQLGPDGINKAVERAASSTVQKSMSYVGPLIAIPVMLAIFAGIALGCLIVTGAQTTFSTVLTACAWAAYAAAVVACAGMTAVVFSMTDFSGVDVRAMFALNAGIFAGEGHPVLKALLGGIDLIAFWSIFLQTVGVTKLSQRVSVAQAVGTFVTLHVVVTLLKTGWAAMFGDQRGVISPPSLSASPPASRGNRWRTPPGT